jgi:membrane associated rhomboid family serine protease
MANFIVEDIKKVFKGDNYLSVLILINAIVFLVLNLILALTPNEYDLPILKMVGLPSGVTASLMRFWTFFTYMFVHKGFFHFLFNVLWLYWMGRILADIYGQHRVVNVYLYGGLFGGALYVLYSTLPFVPSGLFLIGASGGVLAVMVATATLLPDYTLNLMFIGAVRLKYVALVGFVLSTLLNFDVNTGGKIAHIGGAAFGLFYGLKLARGVEITDPINGFLFRVVARFKRSTPLKVVHKNTRSTAYSHSDYATMTSKERQEKTDIILDKIAKSGYDSLSAEEKNFLFRISKNES